MKRVRQIAINGLAVVSALVCMATLILWMRSRTQLDDVSLYQPLCYINLRSVEGRLYFDYWTASAPFWKPSLRLGGGDLARLQYAHLPFAFDAAGFGYGSQHNTEHGGAFVSGREYAAPHWFIFPTAAVAPAAWLRQAVKRRRIRTRTSRGECPACGYDLRATPAGCPECGAVPSEKLRNSA